MCGDVTATFEDRLLHRTIAHTVENITMYQQEYEGSVFLNLTDQAARALAAEYSTSSSAPHRPLRAAVVQYDVFMGSLQDIADVFGFNKIVSWLQRFAKLVVFEREADSGHSSKKKGIGNKKAALEPSQTYVWLSTEPPLSEREQSYCNFLAERLRAIVRCGRSRTGGLTESIASQVLRVVSTTHLSTRFVIDEASGRGLFDNSPEGSHLAVSMLGDATLYSVSVALRIALSFDKAKVSAAVEQATHQPASPLASLSDLFPCAMALLVLRIGPSAQRILASFALRFPDMLQLLIDFLEVFIPVATHPQLRRDDDDGQGSSTDVANEAMIRSVLALMFCACRSPNQLSCYRHSALFMTSKLKLKETGEAVDEDYDDDDDDGDFNDDDDSSEWGNRHRDPMMAPDQSSDDELRDEYLESGKSFKVRVQEMNVAARLGRLVTALPVKNIAGPVPPWDHLVCPPFLAEDYRYCLFLRPDYITEPNVPPLVAKKFITWAVSLLDNRLTDRYALNVCSVLGKGFAAAVSNVLVIAEYASSKPPQVWHRAAPIVLSLLSSQYRQECCTVFSQRLPTQWITDDTAPSEMRLLFAIEKMVGLVERHTNAVSLLQLTSILHLLRPEDDDSDDEESEDEETDEDNGEANEWDDDDSDEPNPAATRPVAAGSRGVSRISRQVPHRHGAADPSASPQISPDAPLPTRLSDKLPFHRCQMFWMHTYRSADYGAKYTCEECDCSCRGYRYHCEQCEGDVCPSCAWERATPDAAEVSRDERLARRRKAFASLAARSVSLFQRLLVLLGHPLCIPVFASSVVAFLEHVLEQTADDPLREPLIELIHSTAAAALQHAASTVETSNISMGNAHQILVATKALADPAVAARRVAELIHQGDPVFHGDVNLGFMLLELYGQSDATTPKKMHLVPNDHLARAVGALQAAIEQWMSTVNLILTSANIADVKSLQKHMTIRDYLLQLLDAVITVQGAAREDTSPTACEGSVASGGAAVVSTPITREASTLLMTRSFFLSRSETELLTTVVDHRSSLSDEANSRDPSAENTIKITEESMAFLASHRIPLSLLFLCVADLSQFHHKAIEHFFLSPKLGDYSIRYDAYNSRNSEVLELADEVQVHVTRDKLLETSFESFKELLDDDLDEIVQIEIVYSGEMGVDAGGPKREFVSAFLQEIVRVGILVQVPDTVTYEINPNPTTLPLHQFAPGLSLDNIYWIVGFVMGMACSNSIPVEIHLAKSMYRHLIGLEPCFSDLESIDPGLFNSLVAVNNMTSSEEFVTLCQAFTVTIGGPSGSLEEVELVPNGSSIMVCDANKKDYIRRRAEFRMTRRVRPQLLGFLKGFYSAHHRSWLKAFTAAELEVVLCGLPTVDIEDMRAHSSYQNCDVTTVQVRWFWEFVSSLPQEELATLMQFSTGCSKVPAGGFAAMRNKFTLNLVQGPEDRLPVAHTCYATIDLPTYRSAEALASKFRTALELGTVGFDLV